MKKVLITGATGIIGIALIKELLKKNIEITAIVRKDSKTKEKLPKDSLIKIIECNLNELDKLDIDSDYDTFYHMGWEGTRGNNRNDVLMQVQNIECTMKAVLLAKKARCQTFIGIGSQAEYGKTTEIMRPNLKTNPDTAYGIAKYCGGEMSKIFANQLNIRHIWARVISTYGPNDYENTMIMSSIKKMIEEDKSPSYTSGQQLWDYIYIDDVANALYLIGEHGKNNSIYCIGSGKSVPLYKYIEEIRNQINDNIKLNLNSQKENSVNLINLQCDISNLTKDTGFKPKVSFKEGIKRTIEWYKKNK